jgi:deazaflavin-dependent oxidoreductase (nitroreductase family)
MKIGNWALHGGSGLGLKVAGVLDRFMSWFATRGVAPDFLVTLEVPGRRSGRIYSIPLVVAVVDGERYLVSMLGADVGWVHNLEASGGRAVLLHGKREEVRLEEVPVEQRARLLKPFLKRALGARMHIAVDKDAPLSEFEKVAPTLPVYRIIAGP